MSGGEWAFVAFFPGDRKPIVRAQITHTRAMGELEFWRKQASTMAVVRSGELYGILRVVGRTRTTPTKHDGTQTKR